MIGRPIAQLALLLGTLLVGGCANYHWGTPSGSAPQSVYIEPVVNDTPTPQVRALLTEQLRRAFAQSPQWRLAEPDHAEVHLAVRLSEARQKLAATDQQDTARGVSFTTALVAEVTLTAEDGTVTTLDPSEVTGVIFSTPGQPESAYQSLPSLTQKLAEEILRKASFQ